MRNLFLNLTLASAFETNFLRQEHPSVGEKNVLRIQIKPTHHLMTDPTIMRMSKAEYEQNYGPITSSDKSDTAWFDSIVDHVFLPADQGHAEQSNFQLGTPPAPAGICLFDNNLSDTILFQSSVYKDNIASYDPSSSSTYVGEDNSYAEGPMYGHNAEDSMCLGSICIDTYPFYYATAQTWWDFRLDDDGENS